MDNSNKLYGFLSIATAGVATLIAAQVCWHPEFELWQRNINYAVALTNMGLCLLNYEGYKVGLSELKNKVRNTTASIIEAKVQTA